MGVAGRHSGRHFFPLLQVGTGNADHQRMSVQAGPGPPLEVPKSKFLLELLMCLLTHPARLDGSSQVAQVELHSPLERHSPTSQTSGPGRCRL